MSSAEERGKRLGFLVASLDVSAEEREALLVLLPQMTEVQLDDLADVLEANYLQTATKKSDEKLSDELKNIDQKYQQAVHEINSNTAKELDAIA
ncbi:MAG: hypothetical protein AAB797_02060 [Patescibacteria group bacterium]